MAPSDDRIVRNRSSDEQSAVRVRFAWLAQMLAAEVRRGIHDLLRLEGVDNESVSEIDQAILQSWAVQQGSVMLLDLLLLDGWNIDAPDAGGDTPLAWAAHAGIVDATALLRRYGADSSVPGGRGQTPPQQAIESDRPSVVAALDETC